MTQLLESPNGNGNAIVPSRPREIRVVEDHGPLANLMDTARFEHLQRIAGLMGAMSVLPDHLVGRKVNGQWQDFPIEAIRANCFRITNQAIRWGMDPFAIVDETYVVGGKLAYQGKLVAAVVNSRANLKGRLNYTFSGTGDDRTVVVSGVFEGETEPRTVDLKLRDAKTDNQMWRKDPDQKLIYSAVVKWARRHCSEIVLGVLTDDDLERMQQQDRAPQPELPAVPRTKSVLAKVTGRPVSEGQTFVPEQNAVEEALNLGDVAGGSATISSEPGTEGQAAAADPPQPQAAAATTPGILPDPAPAPRTPGATDGDLDAQLADMVPDQFLKVLRDKAKDHGVTQKATFERGMFLYATSIGVGDAKKIPAAKRPEVYRAVCSNKFDYEHGRIGE